MSTKAGLAPGKLSMASSPIAVRAENHIAYRAAA